MARARASGRSVEGYLRAVSAKQTEIDHLVTSISFGTTRFFRNASQLSALRGIICAMLKAWQRQGEDRPLKVRSAGSSTGEEAYTLAMVLRDCLPAGRAFEVIGTDLNGRSLEVARRGWYESVGSLPADYVDRFLRSRRQGYLVSEEIRSRVTFRHHNLIHSGAPHGLDVVSCRNVLFYLNEAARLRAGRVLWEAMNPLSFLLIGNSETLTGLNSLFKRVSVSGATIYRRLAPSENAPVGGGRVIAGR